ncbi:helix-turn-helix domain-containing protein [Vibrio splendidus]|uniref:helix-turn-helix domain-containing protein n=1 Tax=Vibrio splendidus TaxID=29497 RepID=UPI0039A4FE60
MKRFRVFVRRFTEKPVVVFSHLSCISYIYEEGSVSKAAKALNLTQPTVSIQPSSFRSFFLSSTTCKEKNWCSPKRAILPLGTACKSFKTSTI